MRKIFILSFLIAIAAFVAPRQTSAAAQSDEILVEMPVPPESMTNLSQRCNFILDKFWNKFNFKAAFSSLDRMDATMGQFFSITPYATADTVFMSINKLLEGVERADDKNIVPLVKIAEKWVGNDTAEYASEQLMYPFAKFVANSKKIKNSPDKQYYSRLAKQLENSMIGATMPDLTFTTPDGSVSRLYEITTPGVILFIYNPKDFDSRLARTRLANDMALNALTNANLLTVVALYPAKSDKVWEEEIENIPPKWVIGSAENLPELITIRHQPQFYNINDRHGVTDKDFSADDALMYFARILNVLNNK